MKGGTGEAVGLPPFSQEPDRTPHQVQVRWGCGGGGDGRESCTGVHEGEKEVSGGEELEGGVEDPRIP